MSLNLKINKSDNTFTNHNKYNSNNFNKRITMHKIETEIK